MLPASAAGGEHGWHGGGPGGGDHGNGHGWGHDNGGGQAWHPGPPPGHGGPPAWHDTPSGGLPLPAIAPPAHPGRGNGNGNGHHDGDAPKAWAPTRAQTTSTPTKAPDPPAPQTHSAGTSGGSPTPIPTSTGAVAPPAPPASPARHKKHSAKKGDKRHRRAAVRRAAAAKRRAARAQKPTLAAALARPAVASPAGSAAPTSAAKRHSPGERIRLGAPPTVVRTLEHVVQVIPTFVKAVIVGLGALLVLAALAWFLLARTARYLRHQREALLGEIGVLQGALLPNVPAELSRLEASVAYKPAEGIAAGGDFYDAFPLDGGRVGIVVGDVAGHGREALMHTALLRYTLRAYLEADLEPRAALQVAGRTLDRGFDTLATVVLAVYDPSRQLLRYASAGHPPPVFLGAADHVPVTQASAPPIGAGLPTGLRQTTVSLPAGSAVCFFTDGLIEARRDGELIGRLGLAAIIRELGPHASASELIERVAHEADRLDDDMAACMFRVSDGRSEVGAPRVEELEVAHGEPLDATLGRFLTACGVEDERVAELVERAARTARQFRTAVVRVSLPRGGAHVEVAPANVESFAAVEARRAAAV